MTTVQTAGRPGAGRGILIRTALIGTALIAVPAGLILAALAFGAARNPGAAAASPAAAPAVSADPYPRLLIALPVILAACYLLAVLSRRLGQPAVIGEIVAGVLLGPSLLGSIWPGAFHWLLPDGVASVINTLAQIGLIFFMFLVGAELDLTAARRRGRTVLAVSQVGIALPVLAGIVLAVWLYPAFGARVGFPGFALFIAVSMSVTAFPVLARILTDRHLAETPLGALALTCAAVGDVAAWCLLGVVVAISRGGSAGRVVATIGLAALFAAAMVWIVRPLLARWIGAVSEAAVLPVVLGGIMLSALATNDIGVHPIFGAFLFGAITPRAAPRIRTAAESMQSVTVALLLPLFFVYTGLHTRFGLLGTNGRLWAWCALITAVAVLAKAGSTAAAARLTGLGPRDSLSLGAMMNCRGLTELVVLNVGLQLKVISPTVFAMLVVMTLISTVATAPALCAIARWRRTGTEP